jgi:hypothetical protein
MDQWVDKVQSEVFPREFRTWSKRLLPGAAELLIQEGLLQANSL